MVEVVGAYLCQMDRSHVPKLCEDKVCHVTAFPRSISVVDQQHQSETTTISPLPMTTSEPSLPRLFVDLPRHNVALRPGTLLSSSHQYLRGFESLPVLIRL